MAWYASLFLARFHHKRQGHVGRDAYSASRCWFCALCSSFDCWKHRNKEKGETGEEERQAPTHPAPNRHKTGEPDTKKTLTAPQWKPCTSPYLVPPLPYLHSHAPFPRPSHTTSDADYSRRSTTHRSQKA